MIETTVVGSYPVSFNENDLIRAYENKKEIFPELVKEVVEDFLSAGIDIISTGQVRTDMISEFTRKIAGIVDERGNHKIIFPIKFVSPITLRDIQHTKTLMPLGKKIKAPITGPFTLANSCTITQDSGYVGVEELAFDFAYILNKEARNIEEFVDVIQIDEPFLSQEFPEYAKDLISIVREGIKKPIALHVCGDVSQIFESLTKFDVAILDHEFTTNENLLDKIASFDFKQKIGYGCVNSSILYVEPVEEIINSVEKAIKILGEDKLVLDPDCGMRHLPKQVAYSKLVNMVNARNKIFGIEKTEAQRKNLSKEDWDQKGYFYIFIDQREKKIRVEHYSYKHVLDNIILGRDAESMLHTVLKRDLVSKDLNGMRHFGYLGTELQKAEIALEKGLDYTQDKKII